MHPALRAASMRALPLALLIVLATAPATLVAATCAGPACATDSNAGDCAADGYEAHSTTVDAAGAASVTGRSSCNNGGASGDGGIDASAGAISAGWDEFFYNDAENGAFHACFVQASTPAGGAFQDTRTACAPNPGWGHVLP